MLPMQAPYGHHDQKRRNIGAKTQRLFQNPLRLANRSSSSVSRQYFCFREKLGGGPEKAQATLQGAASSLLHIGEHG